MTSQKCTYAIGICVSAVRVIGTRESEQCESELCDHELCARVTSECELCDHELSIRFAGDHELSIRVAGDHELCEGHLVSPLKVRYINRPAQTILPIR